MITVRTLTNTMAALGAATLLLSGMAGAGAQTAAAGKSSTNPRSSSRENRIIGLVTINGERISDAELNDYAQLLHARIPAGSYWYDARSGAYGRQGGPTLGFTLAGLHLGGPLQSNASCGNTGVFINGRQLPWEDVRALQSIGLRPQRGRVWLNANGDFGAEGSPYAMGNLVRQAQQVRSQSSGNSVVSEGGSVVTLPDGSHTFIGHRDGMSHHTGQ